MADKLRVADLKEILAAKNLSTLGAKDALVARIYAENPDGDWVEEFLQKKSDDETEKLKKQMAGMQEKMEALMTVIKEKDERVAALAAEAESAKAEAARATEEARTMVEAQAAHQAAEAARAADEQAAHQAAEAARAANEQAAHQAAEAARAAAEQAAHRAAEAARAAAARAVQQQQAAARAAVERVEQQQQVASGMRNGMPHISLNAIAELIGPYDGNAESFESWAQQIRIIRNGYQLSDEMTRLAISARLKGKAQKWFHSKPSFLSLSVEDLLEEMRKIYCPRASRYQLRRRFETRVWGRDEPFGEYAHAKTILANKMDYESQELVEGIIEGIPDEGLRNQARMQKFETLGDLLSAFENISLCKKSEINKVESKEVTKKWGGKPTEKRDNGKSGAKSSVICYNCNESGHFASACLKEKRPRGSCYECASMEHVVKDCPLRKKKAKSNEVANVDKLSNGEDTYYPRVTMHFENEHERYEVTLQTLLDSGSPISFVKSRYINAEFLSKLSDEESNYCGINGSKIRALGKISIRCSLYGHTHEMELLVVGDDTMRASVILGRDAFKIFGMEITKPLAPQSRVGEVKSEDRDIAIAEIMNIEIGKDDIMSKVEINQEIDFQTRVRFENDFREIYVNAKRPETPKTKMELHLKLKPHEAFNFTPRRLAYAEREELKKITDDLLKRGIIRESDSDHCSRVVLIKKKNGALRMCIDYRTLNKYLEAGNFPLPLIDDQIEVLKGKKYFSSIDLKDGFYHLNMAGDSVKYTSFVTPSGQYEFLKMPFGLKVAPQHFQRFISTAFRDLINEGDVTVYIDDILIATNDLEHHLRVLRKVFRVLVENKLEMQVLKCQFLMTTIKYLGYIISERGIKPSETGVESVLNFPIPKNVKGVYSFVSLVSYFRRFIEGFAVIAKPLYELLKKDREFTFGTRELEAFETLKQKLVSSPVLAIYDPHAETELHCDASAVGYGAVLMQKGKDKKMHPIFYFSKRTTDTESRYHSFELEMLAIIYALERFRVYLLGIKFKIITDCNSLALALKKQDINPKIARWVLELQNYDYTTEHRPGERMSHVDGLSRCDFIAVVEDNSFETNLILTQNLDCEIIKIRADLEKTESKYYELRNGIVYRKINEKLFFYVPSEMEKGLLFKYHDELGHMGTEKVVDIISKSYWFPQLRKKVAEHIASCFKCIAYNQKSGKKEGKVQSIPKGDVPFEIVHADHLDLPDVRVKGKKHLLLVTDSFSKFVKIFPSKSTTTTEAVNHLKNYFKTYSKPRQIVTDRGSCFRSEEFKGFVNEYNIDHIQIATQSPWANGEVERINRTLAPMMAKQSDAEIGKYWPKVVDEVEFALNNSVHKTTKETPSMLLFGVPQRGKIHDPLAEFIASEANNESRDMGQLRAKASECIVKSQAQTKAQADKKRKDPVVYKEGDYVMIKNVDTSAGISPKLKPKFKGPYEIIKVLRNNRYVVADIQGWQNTQKRYEGVWEPANMRLWRKGLRSEDQK